MTKEDKANTYLYFAQIADKHRFGVCLFYCF